MGGDHRIITQVPELLASIAHELGTPERGKLMLISRYFFHSVGPMVWRSIPRLDVVMRLIKPTEVKFHSIEQFNGYESRKYDITTTLPLNPDLSRYNIYAPWVQELELFGQSSQQVKNLDSLLSVLYGRPPLPNLRRLTAFTTLPVSSEELMSFINMFICPSLTEIRTILQKDENGILHTSDVRISPSYVPSFLKKVKEICPQIRKLEFYPESALMHNNSERYAPSDQCRSTLSSFGNLRSFSSTTYILESANLEVLGQLPRLKLLGIRGSPRERSILDRRLSIPETWFPVLRDLRLYDVHHKDIQTLWGQPTIVNKLTSTLIQTDHLTPRSPPDDMFHGQNWIGPFLAALPLLSPHLMDVSFFMGDAANRVRIPRESWGFIIRGDVSPGDAYTMLLWPNLDEYYD